MVGLNQNPTWEECGYFLELNSGPLVIEAFYSSGTQSQPLWPAPPDLPAGGPASLTVTSPVGMPRSPESSAQDGGRAKRRRDYDLQIGKAAVLVGQFHCLGDNYY